MVRLHGSSPFEILHGYFVTYAGFISVYAGMYLNIPSVISARGNDLDTAVFNDAKLTRVLYALRRAGYVTANTHDLLRIARAFVPDCCF